jgi:hypothetical protein
MFSNNWHGPMMAFTSSQDKTIIILRAFDIVAVWIGPDTNGEGNVTKIRTANNVVYTVKDTPEEIDKRLFTLEKAFFWPMPKTGGT